MSSVDKLADFADVRLKLMYSEGLFSYILYNLNLEVYDADSITSATNGKELIIGVPFWNKLTLHERISVLLHEIFHVILEHPYVASCIVKSPLDKSLFNMVADVVINKVLRTKYILAEGSLISFSQIDKSCADLDDISVTDHSTLWFYEEVKKRLQQHGKFTEVYILGSGGKSNDSSDNSNKKEGYGYRSCIRENDSRQDRDQMRGVVYGALQAGLGIGNVAGTVKTIFERFMRTQTDWKALVRKWLNIKLSEEYTFARPRQYGRVILPRLQAEDYDKVNIILLVDSSGSIDDKDLYRFACELYTLINSVANKVYLIVNDADIQLTKVIYKTTDIPDSYPGRGGTLFKKAFEHLNKAVRIMDEPIVIVLTDGAIGDLSNLRNPPCPVLWCIINNDNFEAPFGSVISMQVFE